MATELEINEEIKQAEEEELLTLVRKEADRRNENFRSALKAELEKQFTDARPARGATVTVDLDTYNNLIATYDRYRMLITSLLSNSCLGYSGDVLRIYDDRDFFAVFKALETDAYAERLNALLEKNNE